MVFCALSILALNPPASSQRIMFCCSLRITLSLGSILMQILHFSSPWIIFHINLLQQTSPVRYSLPQCCLKWPHFQHPQVKDMKSKKHIAKIGWSVGRSSALALAWPFDQARFDVDSVRLYQQMGWSDFFKVKISPPIHVKRYRRLCPDQLSLGDNTWGLKRGSW